MVPRSLVKASLAASVSPPVFQHTGAGGRGNSRNLTE